ncbi:hypothetical protein [Winogradskyella vidalii]|uniref:hypothetical protein n=1 Tax=Winogradskyella vidalii TaxID=2615024 RepID=UPI0015CB1209|nr:hypothetical protein [Winogradskyella vidalii]
MKRVLSLYVLGLLFFTPSVKAHQPEISTTMLVENSNKVWVLQINASLTAFQQEIKLHYAETPYSSPEEFRQMVIDHIKNNLDLEFNGNYKVALSHGLVKLGHETKVVFELEGVPKEISSVVVKNKTFQDIYNNKSAVVILKEGFDKDNFVLTKDNNHILKLKSIGNKFIRVDEQTLSSSSLNVILILVVIGILGLVVHGINEIIKLKKNL